MCVQDKDGGRPQLGVRVQNVQNKLASRDGGRMLDVEQTQLHGFEEDSAHREGFKYLHWLFILKNLRVAMLTKRLDSE